ncbi:Transposon Tf2-6 polyprotein [Labeo rohita]|uniref:Gypsy retrotransposon integrase-like protein 1 n=1 Tax=Labeo rohita TaxID=84645 RepID=A0ABQ8L2P4_LABRO|nr:Transposon Tf2-6 polyprotein [Labeo rohita]
MVPADLEQLWGVIQQQTMEIMSLKQEMGGLRAEVTALRAETAGLRAECGALQSDLTTLQADYDDLAAAQIAPAEPIRPAHQPKISLPDKWDGSGARCDVFLTNLSLIFEFQPSRYPTDRSRIALLVSLLTGQAAEWATAVLKADGDSAHSYPAFTTQLRAAFQHPESEVEVDSRLYHLRQGERSVSRYTTEFRTLSVQTTWSDAALRTAYYEGLSIRLKDELAVRELPDTLEGMIQLALRVDQRMRHHPHRTNSVSRSSTGTIPRTRTLDSPVTYAVAAPSPPPPIASEAHSTGAGEPMQIGRTSLSAAERARRYREGLCAYCASPDHHRAICPLRPGNGQTSPVSRRTKEIHLIIGNHTEKIQLYITKITSPPVILGHPWLITHDPFISWTNHKIVHWGATCQELCLRAPVGTCSGESEASDINLEEVPVPYRDLAEVFSKRSAAQLPPHRPYDLAIDLVPGAVLPRGHLYSLSATEHQAMEEYVAEGLRAGTIRPSSSPAAAGFFFVKKKDGDLRPCVDYRGLNQITIKNRHPLPLTNTALDALSGARFFTKLDLRSAYNLVRIREGDEWKTAFITPTGHYETLVMPFRLCNSPSVFQQFINDVLRDMLGRWCYAYLDDILIYSKTLEEHTQHVRAVLRRLLAHQLYCKLEKCAFHQHSTTFLGFVISPQGVAMDPQKLEAVRSWPLPSSLKQLQRFLGFANFYRRFIQGFSATAAPLTALTKPSHGAFHLTPEAIQAFKTLCNLFTTAPVLTHPNPGKPFVVEVDTSDVGVGAVLSQRGPDGKLHPCSFFSRKFNSTQQRYGVGDRELLAIKWALEEWRHWLQGGGDPFTVWTDHQNLTVIRQTKQLNPRQARETPPPHVILAPLRWGLEERVRQSHSQNPPPPDTPTGRLFVPDTLRQEVLQWGHDSTLAGHPGVQRTITFIARAFWWRTLRRDVQLYVQACNTCARSKTNNTPSTGELQPLPIPKRPWSHISIDFVTGLPESLGKNTILTIVDRFSKAVHLVALTGLPSAKTTAELILEHVVRLHGFPKDIVSDRGPQFTAKFWQAFCRLIGTTSSLLSGFHPQTNGQTERANQQLERFLRCFAGEHQRSWARYLVWAELSNNIHTSSATNLSPFEVCYGYQPPVFEHQEPEVEVPSAQVGPSVPAALEPCTHRHPKGQYPLHHSTLPPAPSGTIVPCSSCPHLSGSILFSTSHNSNMSSSLLCLPRFLLHLRPGSLTVVLRIPSGESLIRVLEAVAPSISSTGRVTVRRSGLGFPGGSSWIQLSSRTTVVGYPPSRDRLVPVLEGGVLSHALNHVRSRGPGSNFTQVFKQEVGDDPAPDNELMRGSSSGPISSPTHVSKLSAPRSALFTCLCACENADFLVEISTPFWSVLRSNCVVYLLTRVYPRLSFPLRYTGTYFNHSFLV